MFCVLGQCIDVDRYEEVCLGFVRYLCTSSQFNKDVCLSGVDDFDVGMVLEQTTYFHRDVVGYVFLPVGTGRADGARVFATVSGIKNYDKLLVCCFGIDGAKPTKRCYYIYNNV